MIIFVASYATGLGNVPWNQGELFSLDGKYFVPPENELYLPNKTQKFEELALPPLRQRIGQRIY